MKHLYFLIKQYLFHKKYFKEIILLKENLDTVYNNIEELNKYYFSLSPKIQSFIYQMDKNQLIKAGNYGITLEQSSICPFSITMHYNYQSLSIINEKKFDNYNNKYLPASIYFADLLSYEKSKNYQTTLLNIDHNLHSHLNSSLHFSFDLSFNNLQECCEFIKYSIQEIQTFSDTVRFFHEIENNTNIVTFSSRNYEIAWQFMLTVDDDSSENLFFHYMRTLYSHSQQSSCQCYQKKVIDIQLYHDNFWSMQTVPKNFQLFITKDNFGWAHLLCKRLDYLKNIEKYVQYEYLQKIIPDKINSNIKNKIKI